MRIKTIKTSLSQKNQSFFLFGEIELREKEFGKNVSKNIWEKYGEQIFNFAKKELENEKIELSSPLYSFYYNKGKMYAVVVFRADPSDSA
jgi:hypothetical protein